MRLIPFQACKRSPFALQLGYHGRHVDFDWRAYSDRTEEQREDYDRLRLSIGKEGMVNPLIIFEDHVLVGQRRCEIARDLQINPVGCWSILEDVREWTRADVYERLPALLSLYKRAEY